MKLPVMSEHDFSSLKKSSDKRSGRNRKNDRRTSTMKKRTSSDAFPNYRSSRPSSRPSSRTRKVS